MTDWLFRLAYVVLCCAGTVVLGGCLTAEDRQMRDDAMRRQIALQDDLYCKGLSARPGTDAYVNCRLARDSNRIQQQQANAISTAAAQAQQARTQEMANTLIYGPAPGGCTRGVMGTVSC